MNKLLTSAASSLLIKLSMGGLMLAISPSYSFGHNPLSARYHLEAGEQASLLTINLSQDGVDQVLLKHYSKPELEGMNQQRFEEVIVDYIKNNFNLSINRQEIELKEGGIKLGSHQTDLKFVLPSLIDELEEMYVHIPAFKENQQHQTIFSYHINGRAEHLILSLQNNYQATVMAPTSALTNIWLWVGVIGLISLVSAGFFLRNTKEQHENKKRFWFSQ